MPTYPLLSIEDFGAALHAERDLDPVYDALVALDLEPAQRDRFLLAYWVFYHVGVASYLADAPTVPAFWSRFQVAARNAPEDAAPVGDGRWPRGRERRHMRGANAMKCFTALWGRFKNDPSGFIASAIEKDFDGPWPCRLIVERVRDHVGFGPWIAFKVADMLERVVGLNVSFEHAEVFVFDQPKEAALLLWKERYFAANPTIAKAEPLSAPIGEGEIRVRPKDEAKALRDVVDYLKEAFAKLGNAPPTGAQRTRPYGLQEIETVLCKWKSHLNGHYPVGLDRREIHEAAIQWAGVSPTALRIAEALR